MITERAQLQPYTLSFYVLELRGFVLFFELFDSNFVKPSRFLNF
jgi:hypothetical protein